MAKGLYEVEQSMGGRILTYGKWMKSKVNFNLKVPVFGSETLLQFWNY